MTSQNSVVCSCGPSRQ